MFFSNCITSHNSDFGHFELSIQEDCTFDANFFDKNVTFEASKLSARGQFIFCLWSMCTTFSHKFKNITQNGQNQSCDTIALKQRYTQIIFFHTTALSTSVL